MIMSSLAVLAMGCQDDIVVDEPNVNPTPGAEVQFGASMNDVQSRTVYGDRDEENNSYRVNWVNGDEVRIIATNCDRNNALYKINVEDNEQNWADSLDKIGETGIQWGTAPTANFYSVYPAGQVQDVSVAQRKITMRMPHIQNDYIDPTTNTASADMSGAFMYAQTFNAVNGEKVQLGYKPFATAIRFTLNGPTKSTGSSIVEDEVIISQVVLQAEPGTAIAGNFDVVFPEKGENNTTDAMPTITPATVDATGNAYDYVTIFSSYTGDTGGGYLTLRGGESIELNAFVIPSKVTINDKWSLIITLADGTVFKKNLGGKTGTDTSKMTLEPGKIHYLTNNEHKLPNLDINKNVSYDPANWMVNIPRNTYLSEISIPGSWNSMGDAQKINDNLLSLQDQYTAGVRAFHLDTRWKWSQNGVLGYVVSGSFSELAIADGTTSYSLGSFVKDDADTSNGERVMGTSATTFNTAISEIVKNVKKDEYMVLFCTFAQDSADNTKKSWKQAISEICSTINEVYDASKLTSETVVGDVLGKVIVIVCLEDNPTSAIVTEGSKCLFTHAPLTLSRDMFSDAATNINRYQKDELLYGANTSSGITLYDTQAQICGNETSSISSSSRGYGPSLTERKNVGNNILNWSMANYADQDNYTSANWIYLGIGGYYDDNNYDGVALSMNEWINQTVTNMSSRPKDGQTHYYPVGIVLMNHVANYKSVANNILQLNNKYQKAYKADWIGNVDTTEPQADNNATNQWGGPSY